jgi:methylamine utilization protein MauE
MSIMGIEVLLSTGLAIVLLVAAVPKLRHHKGFILAVLEYRVLPPHLSWLYARLVPPLECLLALLLLSGTAVRSAAITISLLLLSFILAVGINLARGRDLDCHCFGKATRRPIGWRLLLQDGALLTASIALTAVTHEWVAPEPWSVFRLSGMVQAGSPGPLLGCAAVTTCTAVLLGRSTYGRRYWERGSQEVGGRKYALLCRSINSERRI